MLEQLAAVLAQVFDLFVHLDRHLDLVIQSYGMATYVIVFAVVFCETGLVIAPFLPGDSLLFALGAFSARGALDVRLLFPLLMIAPFLGDNVNYWAGRSIGNRLLSRKEGWVLNRRHLEKTERFYAKHGAKAVIIARFVPIVRTFAPFVAGIGRMRYAKFISYSVAGSLAWVSTFLLGGYFFGNIPVIKENFTIVIFAIILISMAPGIIEYAKHKFKKY